MEPLIIRDELRQTRIWGRRVVSDADLRALVSSSDTHARYNPAIYVMLEFVFQ